MEHPEGLHPVERTHSGACCEEFHPMVQTHFGAVCEELQPTGRTHAGEDCGELSPVRRAFMLEQVKSVKSLPPEGQEAAETMCDELTVTPIPHHPAALGWRR